jgi:hypothetical protein
MIHNVGKRFVDKYAHGFYTIRQCRANFSGPVNGQMSRTFGIKYESDGIRPKVRTSQCLFDNSQATYFDLRYKGVMMHVLVKLM